MKAIVFLISCLLITPLKAEVQSGFQGCGEYVLKGIVVAIKEPLENEFPMKYKVNIGSKSEMTFSVKLRDDAILMGSYLKQPTTMKVEILEKMDGTIGVVDNIIKIGLRMPDPLNPTSDTGIFLQNKKACKGK